jgi:hypothetical protein
LPNQPFHGIVCFQELNRRFVSPFSHFLSGADLVTPFSSPTCLIIAVNSEKGKLLSAKKIAAPQTTGDEFESSAEPSRAQSSSRRDNTLPVWPFKTLRG